MNYKYFGSFRKRGGIIVSENKNIKIYVLPAE